MIVMAAEYVVSESTALPLVIVFGMVTVLLIRSRDVVWWNALVIGLFGFYLGQTALVFMISGLTNWFFERFTG